MKKYKVLSNLLSFNNQILGNKPRGVVSVHLEYSASANKWLACVWTAVSTDSRSGRAMIRTRVTSHTVYYYLRDKVGKKKYLIKYCSKIYFWMFLAVKVLVYYSFHLQYSYHKLCKEEKIYHKIISVNLSRLAELFDNVAIDHL